MDYSTFSRDGLFSESVPAGTSRSEIDRNRAYVEDHHDELMEEYGGHRIAVFDQGVIADVELTEDFYQDGEEDWLDTLCEDFGDQLDAVYTTDLPG